MHSKWQKHVLSGENIKWVYVREDYGICKGHSCNTLRRAKCDLMSFGLNDRMLELWCATVNDE